MIKLITTFAAAVTAVSLYANHTHKTHSLSRETKVVAITILAEARGEGEAGMYAVGACILNEPSSGSRLRLKAA